jgi:hypothetical protein
MKHPLDLTKEDLNEIMHIPLEIGVGQINKSEVLEILEGKITECSLAGNSPHLPAVAEFRTSNGQIRNLTFFEIKWIKKCNTPFLE